MGDASITPHAGESSRVTEHAARLGPVDTCPHCGGHDFVSENRGDTVVFRCVGCSTAWRYELAYIWPVAD